MTVLGLVAKKLALVSSVLVGQMEQGELSMVATAPAGESYPWMCR